jgi:hypothetical protein
MKHLTEAANSMFRRRLLKTVSSKEEDWIPLMQNSC